MSHVNVTSNREKLKCQSMSEHLQDPENTSGSRRLNLHWSGVTAASLHVENTSYKQARKSFL